MWGQEFNEAIKVKLNSRHNFWITYMSVRIIKFNSNHETIVTQKYKWADCSTLNDMCLIVLSAKFK